MASVEETTQMELNEMGFPCPILTNELPVCTIPMPEEEFQKMVGTKTLSGKNNPENKKKFLDFLSEYIGADCWALTLNSETLFNSYTDAVFSLKDKNVTFKKPYLQILRENEVRYMLAHPNPSINYSLFDYMARFKVSSILNIYMFGWDSYRLQITYQPKTEEFSLEAFMSEDYKKFMEKSIEKSSKE